MNVDPAKHYDEMGEAYIRKSEENVYNVYYDRPAIISLTSDVKDKQVLEVGCGGGVFTEWLVNQGAKVIAFDISEKMVESTKKRLGSKAKVLVADVTKSLDFIETASVDIIIASLVLHYVENWLPAFKEFYRVLRADGFIVMSVHHPHADWRWHKRPSYFRKELYEDKWIIEGKSYTVKYYHRTLANMLAIFRRIGFYVDVLLEPLPLPKTKIQFVSQLPGGHSLVVCQSEPVTATMR